MIAKEKLAAYEKLSVKMAHEIRNYLNSISIVNNNCQNKLQELQQTLSENSFLFEDIYESPEQSPALVAEYVWHKLTNIDKNIEKLSTSEMKVASMIKNGFKTREIALQLHVSASTIATHRKNIRKKLGIRNKETLLENYLLSVSSSK